MAPKRKYGAISSGKASYTAIKRRLKRSRPSAMRAALAAVVPGYTRTGGSYGRYGYSASRLGLTPEKKFFDTALSFDFDLTAEVPASGQLVLIPQGDTESTRDGRKAVIESVQIRAALSFVPAAAATAATITNLWLVLDTQCNGAAAAITDVFTSNVASTAMLNLNNSGRFKILKHWVHTWGPGAGATTAYNNVFKQLEFYKKCKVPIDWSSTTGAITEIRSNNLFLMAGATGTDDLVHLEGNCRVRFRG